MAMTNNGDVGDLLEKTEIYKCHLVFLEPVGGWEDDDCITVVDGDTDEVSGVQILPICWRQIEQKVRQPGIY